MATSSDTPTQPEIRKADAHTYPLKKWMYTPRKASAIRPRHPPLSRPTRISLPSSASSSFRLRFSSISTRMVTASDWVPTFPAMSSTSDWKQMTMGSTATTDSKTPTTEDTPMPRNSSTISHGRRFFMLTNTGSRRSSSEVRPPSLA